MTERYDLTVIIPTFNEEENIAAIIEAVNGVFSENGINGEVLVVDDSSKDRTISTVQGIAGRRYRVVSLREVYDASRALYRQRIGLVALE